MEGKVALEEHFSAGPRHKLGIISWVLFVALGYCHIAASRDGSTHATDESDIRSMLTAYNTALNGGETSMVMPLYTEDGVFMPPYSQSAVGQQAVRSAYEAVFQELKFRVKFNVAEIVVIAPTWAFVRTNSAGTTDHRSTGKTTAESNQELFILRKDRDARWRIARYSFSPTSPPGN
jgi:uncharacterized protein (TIGR02246 family)